MLVCVHMRSKRLKEPIHAIPEAMIQPLGAKRQAQAPVTTDTLQRPRTRPEDTSPPVVRPLVVTLDDEIS